MLLVRVRVRVRVRIRVRVRVSVLRLVLRAQLLALGPQRRHHPPAERGLAAAEQPAHEAAAPGQPAAASSSAAARRWRRHACGRACGGPRRTGEQVRGHRAARRGQAALLAPPLESGDRPLSRPVPVGPRQPVAALRAAARVEAVPALVTEAVPLQALVHLALGQRQAHWALHALIGARTRERVVPRRTCSSARTAPVTC